MRKGTFVFLLSMLLLCSCSSANDSSVEIESMEKRIEMLEKKIEEQDKKIDVLESASKSKEMSSISIEVENQGKYIKPEVETRIKNKDQEIVVRFGKAYYVSDRKEILDFLGDPDNTTDVRIWDDEIGLVIEADISNTGSNNITRKDIFDKHNIKQNGLPGVGQDEYLNIKIDDKYNFGCEVIKYQSNKMDKEKNKLEGFYLDLLENGKFLIIASIPKEFYGKPFELSMIADKVTYIFNGD